MLAYIWDEPGAQNVRPLRGHCAIPTVNVVEVLDLLRRKPENLPPGLAHAAQWSAAAWQQWLVEEGFGVADVDAADCARAADLITDSRRRGPRAPQLSLGDAVCIAVAERLGLPLVGADSVWASLDLAVSYHLIR